MSQYAWVAGGNPMVTCHKPIGSGGFGDVFEMSSRSKKRASAWPLNLRRRDRAVINKFARKTIRCGGAITKEDIETEARVVEWLLEVGRHQNMVRMLDHGWLKDVYNCYFIDMELCDLTLHDYIAYHHGKPQSEGFAFHVVPVWDELGPVFLPGQSAAGTKIHNAWVIGTHIARGLEFMHMHKFVHRDLKPKNVLFCRNDNQWKLTDFGVSAVATSKKAVATLHSRGTASYRPPELLGEDAEFTNKVDIWALGCVLHELSTGKVAFREDWTVRQYSFDTEPLPISFPSIPKFLENHMSRNILHLLSKKWNDRPGASKACEIFSSYCEFLKSLRELAFQLQWGPTYDEWTKLLMDTPDGSKDFLIRIADLFETNGRKDIAVHLRREPSGNGKGSKPATDANPDAITQIGAQMSTLNIPSTLPLVYRVLQANVSAGVRVREPDIQLSIPHINDFNFLAVIGKGLYGKVMLAEDKETRQLYAIKTKKKKLIEGSAEQENISVDKKVSLIAKKDRHPFLVNLYACFQTEKRFYSVMEYIAGGDLMYYIQKDPLRPEQIRFYAAEIVLALKYLHENEIIYRDLNLENMLLTVDGHLKLINFGTAKCNLRFGNKTRTFCGNPAYMAPEVVVLEESYGHEVDWWAFGIVLYQMICRTSPFVGDDEDEGFDAILSDEPIYSYSMSSAPGSWSIIQELLTKEPYQRLGFGPQGASDVMDHVFFLNIDFDDIFHKRVPPPFLPMLKTVTDTSNFDKEFTSQATTLSPTDPVLSEDMQNEFRDFAFVAPDYYL